MFEYKITLSDNTQFNLAVLASKTIESVTPAEHFCFCVHSVVNLLKNLERSDLGAEPTGSIVEKAINGFLTTLHKRPEFSSGAEVLKICRGFPLILHFDETKTSHPNFIAYGRLYSAYLLYQKSPDIKRTPLLILEALMRFVIPGIKRTVILTTLPSRQEQLELLDFPAELIPKEFLCQQSSHIMTVPAYDGREAQQARLEEEPFRQHLKKNGKNPITGSKMTAAMLRVDSQLKEKIGIFMTKAFILCCNSFHEDTPPYEQFLAFLLDDSPIEIFEAIVKLVHMDTAGIIIASPYSSPAPAFFRMPDRNIPKEIVVAYLFNKYDVTKDDNPASLGKVLRRAAASGHATNVQVLLEILKVNSNSQDATPDSKKSALHWVVIKAQTKQDNSELLLGYKRCIKLLLRHGADRNLTDAIDKTAADYDSNELFSKQFSAASMPSLS